MMCLICGKASIETNISCHLPFFYQCSGCGGYIHQEGPPPAYKQSYFIEQGKACVLSKLFNPCSRFFLWLRWKIICKALGKKDSTVLDYGCGNGKLVRYLLTKELVIDGFDPSQSAVDLSGQEHLPVYGEIPKKQYDLIMFWHSLEHSDTPQADLKGCLDFLRPNGKLLIAVPNGESLEAKIAKDHWFCYDWPFHRVHFTPSSIEIMLHGVGYRVNSVDYLNIEYTISSLVQTFLNFFLPKNALYSIFSNRRIDEPRGKLICLTLFSCVLLCLFFPLLLFFFLAGLVTKRTAAFIVTAVPADN